MSSIKGLATTPITQLVGRTVEIHELRDEAISILTAFDLKTGQAFILKGEIKEAKATEPKQMTEQKDIFVLSRKGKDDLKESTILRYDRAEQVITSNPKQLRKIVELRNQQVATKNISKQLNMPRNSLNLMISVAQKRGYIVKNGNQFKLTEKFMDTMIKSAA